LKKQTEKNQQTSENRSVEAKKARKEQQGWGGLKYCGGGRGKNVHQQWRRKGALARQKRTRAPNMTAGKKNFNQRTRTDKERGGGKNEVERGGCVTKPANERVDKLGG